MTLMVGDGQVIYSLSPQEVSDVGRVHVFAMMEEYLLVLI